MRMPDRPVLTITRMARPDGTAASTSTTPSNHLRELKPAVPIRIYRNFSLLVPELRTRGSHTRSDDKFSPLQAFLDSIQ